MSIGTGQNISSIGATPYVPYSAIELVGNIQATAFLVFVLAMAQLWAFQKLSTKPSSRRHNLIWALTVCLSLVVLAVSTFVRIWL